MNARILLLAAAVLGQPLATRADHSGFSLYNQRTARFHRGAELGFDISDFNGRLKAQIWVREDDRIRSLVDVTTFQARAIVEDGTPVLLITGEGFEVRAVLTHERLDRAVPDYHPTFVAVRDGQEWVRFAVMADFVRTRFPLGTPGELTAEPLPGAGSRVLARCELERRCTPGSSETGASCTPGLDVTVVQDGEGVGRVRAVIDYREGRTVEVPVRLFAYGRGTGSALLAAGDAVQVDVLTDRNGRRRVTGQIAMDVFEVGRIDSYPLFCEDDR